MIEPDALVRAVEPMHGCETELDGDGKVVGSAGTGDAAGVSSLAESETASFCPAEQCPLIRQEK